LNNIKAFLKKKKKKISPKKFFYVNAKNLAIQMLKKILSC